jgi:site-specific DNA-methyltransferase (adenine-specific)
MKNNSNIKYIDGYIGIIKDTKERYKSTIERMFGADMTFDVVIGNPPYNRGMDLDFVNMGFELSEKYCVMITPAKWQTAADDYSGCASKTIDYKGFRKKLVPHMRHVVFYPDCGDVFNIGQADGITYYLIDKQNKCNKTTVENRCKLQNKLNSVETRSITNRESLINIGNEIVEYIGNIKKFSFSNQKNCRYQVWTNNQINPGFGRWGHSKIRGGTLTDGGGNGGFLLSLDGQLNMIGKTMLLDTSKGEKSTSGSSKCTFSSDSRAECESFVSWLNTKFTRFFVAINISKMGPILTDDCFRFVPAPPSGKFDHIYTDEELYKAFNLPQKYIDVIEAVIKERK